MCSSDLKNLSAAQLAKVDGLLKAIAAGEEQARATRRLVAAYQSELDVMAELDAAYVAASKAREQGRLAVDAYVQGIAASAEQVALEQSLFGQSTRNRAIALEQYQIELDLKKQIAAINANAGFNQAQRDEEIALRFLQQRAKRAPAIFASMKQNFTALSDWMQHQHDLEWVKPEGGVVCFPRFRSDCPVDIERFYRILNDKYKTFVGPGHWFEMERRYLRIGYGWPSLQDLREGLSAISLAAKEAQTASG